MKITPYFLFLLLALTPLVGLSQIHLEGEVRISMKTATISCDFELSNIPEMKAYNILLNKGMNIKFFQDSEGRILPYSGYYNGIMRGEALAYTLIDEKRSLLSMPKTFHVQYRGAFPIYDEPLNSFDFKGLIAFNGKTLRAAEQSKWYPVIYDLENDRIMDDYTYSIRIICDDCQSVFINGDIPKQVTDALYHSTVPRQLMLFTGDYSFQESKGNYILNAQLDSIVSQQIFAEIDFIKKYYSKLTGIPYDEKVYLVSHQPVSPYRPDQNWGFAIFPTFAYAGLDFKTLVDVDGKMDPSDLAFFAHELAHYYFNTRILSGPLGWFWLESTAEYFSLKVSEEFNPEYYLAKVKGYGEFLNSKKYPPLAKIIKSAEVDEDYRYVYGPLILLAFEGEFGKNLIFSMLTRLSQLSANQRITLSDFRSAAIDVGVSEDEFTGFEAAILTQQNAMEETIKRVLEKLE